MVAALKRLPALLSFKLGRKNSARVTGSILFLFIAAAIALSAKQNQDPAVTPDASQAASPSPSPSSSLPPLSSPPLTPEPSLASASSDPAQPLPPGVPAGVQAGYVAKHVDGDTIWVEVRDPGPLLPAAVHKIRILEIDTPESTNRKDCFGREASEFAKRELPLGSKVYLLADKQDKDRYGRFLRYVWTQNGDFYNEKAIKEGLARAVLYPPNDLYINQLRAAEAEAKHTARGLWVACGGQT